MEYINSKDQRRYVNEINDIVAYLNEAVDTHYRPTSSITQRLIIGRLREGFTVEDFKTVIDKKCEQWLNTDFEMYLRPITLFDSKHFEDYLNQRIYRKRYKGITNDFNSITPRRL